METSIKSKPILFSGPMVNAIRQGRKTQTRRVIKLQPDEDGLAFDLIRQGWFDTSGREYKCPYGRPGDRLWVRETWGVNKDYDNFSPSLIYSAMGGDTAYCIDYNATPHNEGWTGKWRSSIHMPRWASRITLEIVSVRVERLQDITLGDILAEGFDHPEFPEHLRKKNIAIGADREWKDCCFEWFQDLWEDINGLGSWELNPWVWAIGFKRIKP